MFTGLVEEVGRIESVERRTDSVVLRIAAERVVEGTRVGDSIAVSGACLTVVRVGNADFDVEMIPETASRTNLDRRRAGDRVNLERSLKLGERIGGHLVLGHVDGLAKVVEITNSGPGTKLLRLRYPRDLASLIAEKGSLALEGVSLTVTAADDEAFSVALIPHTLKATTLGEAKNGDDLNLEVDVLARYVARHLDRQRDLTEGLTEEWMRGEGYG
jgi:riboflavin synthase